MGFSLFNGTGPGVVSTNNMATIGSAARFSFYFLGGQNDYYIWDGNGVTDTGVAWTDGGLSFEFALRTADTYRLVIKSADGSTTLAVFDGYSLQNTGTLDSFACYNLNAGSGGDVFLQPVPGVVDFAGPAGHREPQPDQRLGLRGVVQQPVFV